MKNLTLVIFLFPCLIQAQGKLVLVGGGSEEIGGWSDIPYQWIVAHSANKRIAVISYTDETDFIPNYFIALGAQAAVNIKIDSRNLADLQSTYDSLMSFDGFFFKGGDQSYYYTYFKNTKTQNAIIDKFNEGGVMSGTSAGMAILSGVMFTAIHDSVYPDDMLSNFKNSSATLANDFLPFFPGYLFDTHFTERGRGARLIGFMNNWFTETGELLNGIGVDDRTALCIDSLRRATIYGTGAVSIYNSASFSSFTGNKPLADSIHVVQLLHGHAIDLSNGTILDGPTNLVYPTVSGENGNYQVLLSGGEGASANNTFIEAFIASGNPTDSVIVVTNVDAGAAYFSLLAARSVPYVPIETSSSLNDESRTELRNNIRRSRKILFAQNNDVELFKFLESGPTGKLLALHLKRNNVISGFVGEDSRYAGKVIVTNHLDDPYNAYYGRLNYRQGLGLLQTSIIMANTYDANSSDYYENTTAAVPYAMVRDSLRYGIYLERNSYLKFYQHSGSNFFTAPGQLSTIVISNAGTLTEFETQPVNTSGDTRDYVGFREMKYTLLNGPTSMKVGVPQPTNETPYELERVTGVSTDLHEANFPFPNPSENGIFFLSGHAAGEIILGYTVRDVLGTPILKLESRTENNFLTIDLSGRANGVYFLTWYTATHNFSSLLVHR